MKMSGCLCDEERMRKKLPVSHDMEEPTRGIRKIRKNKCDKGRRKEKHRLSYRNGDKIFLGGVDVAKKKPRRKCAAAGRTAPPGEERKVRNARPRRWRKHRLLAGLMGAGVARGRRLRSTYESLPKFSDGQLQQRAKAVRGGVVEASVVQQVRRHVTARVLEEQGLADVALHTYNNFLDQLTSSDTRYSLQFENELGKHVLELQDIEPHTVQHTPLLCRQEERSYLLPLTVRVSYSCVDGQDALLRSFSHRVFLGEVPLMVGSKLCPTTAMTGDKMAGAGQQPGEPGGYFIVDGIEKFIPFRNVHKKNNLLVVKCCGQEGQKFSYKCCVFSCVSGTESFQTVVLASTKHSLLAKLSLGRGVTALVPLSKLLAASGIHTQPHTHPEPESLRYLRRTLSAILSLKEQQQQKGAKDGGTITLTRDAFRGPDGGRSRVAGAILDYLAAASRVPGVTEQDLYKIHRKCEKSATHHAALVKIAANFVHMSQKETRQHHQYKSRLSALRDVMLQGCEDISTAVHMVTAALTLPSEEEALKAIRLATKGGWKTARMSEVLERVLVPHAGGGLKHRAFYIAYMVNQLLLVLCGRRAADDPLHLGNRMLLTPGAFVRNLFDSVMKSILQQARDTLEQRYKKARPILPEELDYVDHYHDDERTLGKQRSRYLTKNEKKSSEKFDLLYIFQFHQNIICEKMCKALRTGTWGEGPSAMKGVTQNLQRLNYMQYLSQVRTVNGEDKVIDGQGAVPHQLHTSIVGFFCLMETPENEHVGLTEHLALGASVCLPLQPAQLLQLLHTLPVKVFAGDECPIPDRLGKVFVDGRWVGNAKAPLCGVRECLLDYRRRHTLHLGLHLRNYDLHIDTSGGRPVRPLLVVRGGALTVTTNHLHALREGRVPLDDLWRAGLVDFMDAMESSEAFIAETPADMLKKGVDYCQLQAVLSFGIVSAAIPVGNTNPGVRRLGSCKMQKQAMGRPVLSEVMNHRGTYSVLKTPELPLAIPAFILALPNAALMYSGQSALTAVMAVRGLNQEDGLVFSQGAVTRGLFTSLHYHSYRKCEPHLGAEVTACAEVGQCLEAGDVVITCLDELCHVRVEEIDGPSQVTRSRVRYMPDSRVLYEVETVQERKPEVGDKFATLNGQKGVICGIVPDHQLPRLEDGRTPDIFISPHSFLDRQTVGFFVEGMLNSLALQKGCLVDATSIDAGWDLPRTQQMFLEHGLSSSVKVVSSSGRDMGHVFCHPIFYMRLKHLAVLKCHARHHGPLEPVFRQPTEGLAHGGGLRLGEMEVAALVSHGAADLVQELLHDQSDGLHLPYCNTCLRWAEMVGEYVSCRSCRRTGSLVLRRTTYAFKFFEECLMMMNLRLLQYGQGHKYRDSDIQHNTSALSSMSSNDEWEWKPQDRHHNAVETLVKRSWRKALKLNELVA